MLPFLAVLAVLSVLDVVGSLLGSGAPPEKGSAASALLYGNLVVPPAVGGFKLGILDLFVIVAVAEVWRRRGGSPVSAEMPGLAGLGLASLFVVFGVHGGIPLIPFLTVGWLLSEGLSMVVPKH